MSDGLTSSRGSVGVTVNCGTSDLLGSFPDDLRKVPDAEEVGARGNVRGFVVSPIGHLTVVPLVGDGTSSVLGLLSV